MITCRGNVLHFLLSMESNNTIYGITTNPYDETRTAGGSSGGEAVNIVQGFCNASIGTDIAGSVRIPALFCGLVGFKPTTMRLSSQAIGYMFERRFGSDQRPGQVANNLELQAIFPNQLGVISKSVEDASRLMQVLVRDQAYDNLVAPLPWNPQPRFARRLGVVRQISYFEPCASSARALQETVAKLEARGYVIVELDLEEILAEVIYWANVVYFVSPYLWETITGRISLREELFPMYEAAKKINQLPFWLVKIIRYLEGDSRTGRALAQFIDSKTHSQTRINAALSSLYVRLERKLSAHNVSALLSVGLPLPAIKLYSSNHLMMMCGYLFVFNFLKMPAGVVPVTRVRENEQFYESRHRDKITECAKQSMEGSAGRAGVRAGFPGRGGAGGYERY